MKNQTTIHCKHNTAGTIFIILGASYLLIGCTQFYKTIGLTDEQAAEQTQQDQTARQIIIQNTRTTITQVITTIIAGVGTVLSGLLAKWLGTERKITSTLIKAIETYDHPSIKQIITAKALDAGIEPTLNKRVSTLT